MDIPWRYKLLLVVKVSATPSQPIEMYIRAVTHNDTQKKGEKTTTIECNAESCRRRSGKYRHDHWGSNFQKDFEIELFHLPPTLIDVPDTENSPLISPVTTLLIKQRQDPLASKSPTIHGKAPDPRKLQRTIRWNPEIRFWRRGTRLAWRDFSMKCQRRQKDQPCIDWVGLPPQLYSLLIICWDNSAGDCISWNWPISVDG